MAVPMFANLRAFFLSCGLIFSSLVTANEQQVLLENGLEKCVKAGAITLSERNNLLLAETDLTLLQSIGYCGCKSAVASYAVVDDEELIRHEMFILKDSRRMSFVISNDILRDSEVSGVNVRLSCGN
ncbi:DUF2195 family protein [Litoribrevibacter euphylliae]|uniref:DUF2195 family protein n=2 Tax=Litoribrevibacter euphylliae TaxID=1834034 RepID=A0ABV7HD58_9GAMM